MRNLHSNTKQRSEWSLVGGYKYAKVKGDHPSSSISIGWNDTWNYQPVLLRQVLSINASLSGPAPGKRRQFELVGFPAIYP
jgi:hypothetical protein